MEAWLLFVQLSSSVIKKGRCKDAWDEPLSWLDPQTQLENTFLRWSSLFFYTNNSESIQVETINTKYLDDAGAHVCITRSWKAIDVQQHVLIYSRLKCTNYFIINFNLHITWKNNITLLLKHRGKCERWRLKDDTATNNREVHHCN